MQKEPIEAVHSAAPHAAVVGMRPASVTVYDATVPRREEFTGVASTLFGNSLLTGTLSSEDKAYLGRLIAIRTGLDRAAAENWVDQLYSKTTQTLDGAKESAKDATQAARAAAARISFQGFIAFVYGAFSNRAAIVGERHRSVAAVRIRPIR